jgi:hypothetical protein
MTMKKGKDPDLQQIIMDPDPGSQIIMGLDPLDPLLLDFPDPLQCITYPDPSFFRTYITGTKLKVRNLKNTWSPDLFLFLRTVILSN